MRPRLSILDARFKYRCAARTDVRETFERVRAELAQSQQIPAPTTVVVQLTSRKAGR